MAERRKTMQIFNIDNSIIILYGVEIDFDNSDYVHDINYQRILNILISEENADSEILFFANSNRKTFFKFLKIDEDEYTNIVEMLYKEQIIKDINEVLKRWHFSIALDSDLGETSYELLCWINEQDLEQQKLKKEIDKGKKVFLKNMLPYLKNENY